MKKIIWIGLVLISQNVNAIEKGIHVVFDFNKDQGETAAVGTANYYYQQGDMLTDVTMKVGALKNLTMLEINGSLYSLSVQDKTYMQIPDFVKDAVAKTSQSESKVPFVATGKKKKIAGYDCEVFSRKTTDGMDSACLNQVLYKQYKDLFSQMQSMAGGGTFISGVQGFPLEASSFGNGANKKTTTMLVKSIDQGNFQAKLSIPKGYQEKNAAVGAAELLQKLTNGSK